MKKLQTTGHTINTDQGNKGLKIRKLLISSITIFSYQSCISMVLMLFHIAGLYLA